MSEHGRISLTMLTALAVGTLLSGLWPGFSGVRAQEAGLTLDPSGQRARAASPAMPVGYTLYGTTGLIDMPSAASAPDAELAATLGQFARSTRATLSFQITERLSGSFRYSYIDNYVLGTGGETYDRSFDVQYRFADEGRFMPAMAIGLRDFIGTGVYSGEYVVATKTLTPRLRVTGGLGWGRLGTQGGFTNPLGALDARFETRSNAGTAQGGTLRGAEWFRGPAALFGGVEWQASDRLTLMAEYSSDAYALETAPGRDHFTHRTPFNFGASYRLRPGTTLSGYYMHGDTLAAQLTLTLNPRHPPVKGSIGPAPLPVARRPEGAAADTSWTAQADARTILEQNLQKLLGEEGLILEGMRLDARRAEVRVENTRYGSTAQAIGRTARVMSNVMPASVESFTILPMTQGIPASAVTLRRSDLEALELAPDGNWQSYVRARIDSGAPPPASPELVLAEGLYPRFEWGLGPYGSSSFFDPDSPVRLELGARLKARYEPTPGLILKGSVQKRVVGNIDDATRPPNSVLPHVRTDAVQYSREGDPAITELTAARYFRPGRDFYGRVTAGYLEQMFGGVSAEILWKPPAARLALGAELNYVKKRDFDQLFGFQDYDVVTGHVSAYWDMGNDYHAQLDVGRYLAGDWGATLALDREFANGWKVGAYATLTDVPFSDFGEGSFDKGLRFTVPLEFFTGRPSTTRYDISLRPITRDGGARLNVQDRLYKTVRGYQDPGLAEQWGRFWR
ncbi:YjbH domain-containing protein [Brevirhabdus pacifica]|nr:YjbH domain-containing protein [Brevirhabdus pacifica]